MTTVTKPRSHLVERAIEALGGAGALGRLTTQTPPASDVSTAPPAPPAEPPPQDAAPEAAVPPLASPEAAPDVIGWEALKNAGLVVGEVGVVRSRVAEEISIIQHQLLRTMRAIGLEEGRLTRSILVTSARPGEGKTFTSLNLAASIAASGARPVLLVDADGKRGSVTELMGVHRMTGLRALAGPTPPASASLVLRTAQSHLSFLPYGAPVEGEPSVPPGAKVAAALQRLAAALPDHVLVIDSPPCLSTSDPSSLAAIAGQVLLVVEAERTQRAEVEAALDMVEACPHLQLALNRTRLTANDTFGAYGGYDVYGAYGPRMGE